MGATQAAVLEERARIARELHDTVSQTLYALTLGACRARTLLRKNERTDMQGVIDDLVQLATTAQSEVRALLNDIHSDQRASPGLTAALTDLVADVRTLHGLAAPDIRLSDMPAPNVAAPITHALLMIAREALHNVIKHSAACRVDITLEYDAGKLTLLIGDDGRGFDPATPRPGHFGLQSMRERAAAVGGTLALISAAGVGTQLRVCIPVHTDDNG